MMEKAEEYYREALWANEIGEFGKAYEFHLKAFEENPHFTWTVLRKEHTNFNYEYKPVEEVKIINCSLCGKKGNPHWVYSMLGNKNFIESFSPVRMWYKCESCRHLFAHNYPKNILEILNRNEESLYIKPDVFRFAPASIIVTRIIKQLDKKGKWLDVGFGAGDMLLVLEEYGIDAVGIDLSSKYVNNFKKYESKLEVFHKNFETDELDECRVVLMGDVLEHFIDPRKAIKKVYQILEEKGTLWISTPNFESGIAKFLRHADPMRKVCEHLNYFSYYSLSKLLIEEGFEIKDYHLSEIVPGGMEIIARKI